MIEVIDNNNVKRLAKVMCGLLIEDDLYVLYLIKRDKDSVNVFCSRVVKNSEQVSVIDSDFSEKEKRKLDDVCRRIFNKDSVSNLEKYNIKLVFDMDINDGINKFDIDKSYVSTMSNEEIDVCNMYYGFKLNSNKKIIKVNTLEKDKDPGFVSNILVLIFAITFLGICVYLLIDMFILG